MKLRQILLFKLHKSRNLEFSLSIFDENNLIHNSIEIQDFIIRTHNY